MCTGVTRHAGIGINPSCLRAPVRGGVPEEIGGCDGHRGRMGRNEVDLLLVSVVALHIGQVGWVFVHGGLGGMGLQGLSDAVEVKLVGVALAVHFGHDVFVVVVAQGAAQFVVVHVGLALALAPATRYFVGVRHLELSVGPFPGDAAGVGAVREELEQELPQLDLT